MRVAACWVVSFALAPAAAYCADEAAAPTSETTEAPALRLRIEWGFGAVRAWQGTISVSEGRVSTPQPLGIEADEAYALASKIRFAA